MPTSLKRSRRSPPGSVSPPPVKRRAPSSTLVSPLPLKRKSSCIKITSWNVNGVGPLLQKHISFDNATGCPLRHFLERHDWPHFLCLQEVKISPRDKSTQRRLQHAANAGSRAGEPTYLAFFSLPRDRYNATGFGGKVHGVATLIREDLATSVHATRLPDWDLEGRVLVHELKNNVVVINSYWVNGTTCAYRDPRTGNVTGDRHDHKRRFHKHMLEEIMSLECDHKHVVVVGDMNVARSRMDGHPHLRVWPVQHVENRYDFNQKFFDDDQGLKGVDVFRQLHGDTKKYTYYPRGCGWGESCDRVDLIIVTRALYASGAVHTTDICNNSRDRGHSDHVPLWIDLDMSKVAAT